MRHFLRIFLFASVKQKVERSCGFHLKCYEAFQLQKLPIITFYPWTSKKKIKRNVDCFIGTCKINSKSTCDDLNDTNRPLILWDTCVRNLIMIEKYASKHCF